MRTKASVCVTFGLLAVLAGGAWVWASGRAEQPAAARPADEQAIRAAAQAFAKAFEKGDAAAVAALFTDAGEFYDDSGKAIRGRAALTKAYADFFAKRAELKTESKTDAIRFLGQDTAIEEGTFTVRAKDQPAMTSRYSALYVRQDGKWLMAMLKEWGDDTTDRASLDDIAWLIGNWESTAGDVTARTTYEWAPTKAFIIVQYSIATKGADKPMIGKQVIGVDPASGMLRSWTFDADGSIGDATWSWDEGRWAIDSAGTLADGSGTTALNFLTKTGPDSFTWKSVKRMVNGESLPDIGPVTVKRVKGQK
jgi:uncharacterized protein (TIGR02246 family)